VDTDYQAAQTHRFPSSVLKMETTFFSETFYINKSLHGYTIQNTVTFTAVKTSNLTHHVDTFMSFQLTITNIAHRNYATSRAPPKSYAIRVFTRAIAPLCSHLSQVLSTRIAPEVCRPGLKDTTNQPSLPSHGLVSQEFQFLGFD
jgi:hypothetical protein